MSLKRDSTLDFSPMMFFSLEADMTGALLNSKNKCGARGSAFQWDIQLVKMQHA